MMKFIMNNILNNAVCSALLCALEKLGIGMASGACR